MIQSVGIVGAGFAGVSSAKVLRVFRILCQRNTCIAMQS